MAKLPSISHIAERIAIQFKPPKTVSARRLREEAAVSLRWIAENLYMGTWTHVSSGEMGSEPLYDEQDRAQFVELLTPSRVLEIVVDDVANTLRLFGLRKSIRNHRASHSVADGDMTNRTGTFIRLPPRIARTDSDCFFLHTIMNNC